MAMTERTIEPMIATSKISRIARMIARALNAPITPAFHAARWIYSAVLGVELVCAVVCAAIKPDRV